MLHIVKELKTSLLEHIRGLRAYRAGLGHDFGDDGRGGDVVVFVPGFTITHALPRNGYRKKLQDAGFKVVVFNPGNTTNKDIPSVAVVLADFVEQVCAREQAPRVALVCHSMGGLVGRYYLEKLGGHRRVRKLFAIASPFHGTKTALLAPRSRAAQMMRPNSEFLRELNAMNQYIGRIVAIRGTWDHVIRPISSAYLEWAKNYEIHVKGHIAARDSDEVAKIVKKELA